MDLMSIYEIGQAVFQFGGLFPGKTERLKYDQMTPLISSMSQQCIALLKKYGIDQYGIGDTVAREVEQNVLNYFNTTSDWKDNEETTYQQSLINNILEAKNSSRYHGKVDYIAFLFERILFWIFRNGDPRTGYANQIVLKWNTLFLPVFIKYTDKFSGILYMESSANNQILSYLIDGKVVDTSSGNPRGDIYDKNNSGNGNNGNIDININGNKNQGNETGNNKIELASLFQGNGLVFVIVALVLIGIFFFTRKGK